MPSESRNHTQLVMHDEVASLGYWTDRMTSNDAKLFSLFVLWNCFRMFKRAILTLLLSELAEKRSRNFSLRTLILRHHTTDSSCKTTTTTAETQREEERRRRQKGKKNFSFRNIFNVNLHFFFPFFSPSQIDGMVGKLCRDYLDQITKELNN